MAQPNEQFARLFAKHEHELYRYVLTLVPHPADAEDIVQEAAADLWRKFDEYDADKPFLPWAARFAFVEVMRHRKRENVRRKYFSDAVVEALADDRLRYQQLLVQQRRALDGCLSHLKPGERELIETRYGEDKTIVELAQESGRPTNTLYVALTRLRRKLLTCLNRSLADEVGP
ncbi:MAG: sigma-70 family RNA polymerase sigma factor [Planctomycetes bacterium]|nr:sigma-70 family RNA polymerase sigma factor [Planctomycetota bacterium]